MKLIEETKIGNYSKSVFDNGLRVISEFVPEVKSFALGFYFNVGSRDDKISGTAHYLEHILFKNTKKRDKKQIADTFDLLGAFYNAETEKENTHFYVRCISSRFEEIFELFSDITLNTIFVDDELEKEKLVVLEELKFCDDETEEYIVDLYDKVLYGNNAMARPIGGTLNSVSKIYKDDLIEFYNNFYGYDNLIVCVAGDVSHNKILELVDKYFDDKRELKKNSIFSSRQVPSIKQISINENIKFHRELKQSYLMLGKITPGFYDNEKYARNVINIIFGDGASSRLSQNLREKHGLAYTVYSGLTNYSDCGSLYISAIVDNKNYNRAIDLIYEEILDLKNNIPNKVEILKAKEQLKTDFILSLEDMNSRIQTLYNDEIIFNRKVSIKEFFKLIDNISLDDLMFVIDKYFNIDNWIQVALLATQKKNKK